MKKNVIKSAITAINRQFGAGIDFLGLNFKQSACYWLGNSTTEYLNSIGQYGQTVTAYAVKNGRVSDISERAGNWVEGQKMRDDTVIKQNEFDYVFEMVSYFQDGAVWRTVVNVYNQKAQ